MSSGIKIAFGGAGFGRNFSSPEDIKGVTDTLHKYGVKIIDTAQLYGDSEQILGSVNAGKEFTIDTKWKGGFGGEDYKTTAESAKESLERLKQDKVDIFYIHAPIKHENLDDYLAEVNKAYKAGYFARFGLSNYKAEDVQAVYDTAKKHGYVLPTAYQGNYSPIARLQESLLFPTLRKLGIAFYAYSPLAGGFLTKTKDELTAGAGRFDPSTPIGKMYSTMYNKPSYVEALTQWEAIAKENNISRSDLGYRWVTYNSDLKPEHGDAIIVGARDKAQLEQTLQGIKAGPLSQDAVAKIDKVWETIKHDAPLDNFHM